MGFMAGFGPAFAAGLERNADRKARKQEILLSSRLKDIQDRTTAYTKAKAEDAANVKLAKSLVEMVPGAPKEVWKDMYSKLSSGVPQSSVLDFYKNVNFQKVEETPAPVETKAPAVETQMEEAIPTASTQPAMDVSASGVSEAPVTAPDNKPLDFMERLQQRRDERLSAEVDQQAKDILGEDVYEMAGQTYTPTDFGSSGYTAIAKPKDKKTPKYLDTIPTKNNIQGLVAMAQRAKDSDAVKYLTDLQKAYTDTDSKLPDIGSITTKEKWNGVFEQVQLMVDKPEGYDAWLVAFNRHGEFLNANDESGDDLSVDQRILNAQQALTEEEAGTPEHTALIQEITNLTRFQQNQLQRTGDKPEYLSPTGQIIQSEIGVDQGTGEQILVDGSTGQPIGQTSYFELTPTSRKTVEEFNKFNNTAERKYLDSLDALPSTAKLSQSIIQEIEAEPTSVTRVASGVATIMGFGRELDAIGQLFAQKDKGEISEQEFTSQLARAEEQYLERAERNGVNLENLANASERVTSKILLLTFRIGRMEGQTGMAMSNADREIFMQILKGKERSPEVIKSTLQRITHDYVTMLAGMSDQSKHSTAKKMIRAFPEIDKDIFKWKSLDEHMEIVGQNDPRAVEAVQYFLKNDGYSSERASAPVEDSDVEQGSIVSADELQKQLDALTGGSN